MTSATTPRMRLTVIGTGYLGATHAACLAELGFEVLGVDTDAERIERIADFKGFHMLDKFLGELFVDFFLHKNLAAAQADFA